MHRPLKAYFKLALLVLWAVLCYASIWLAYTLGKKAYRDRFLRLLSSGILRIVGIRLKITGVPVDSRPLLLVTNHLSYTDIPVLASRFTMRFMPKSEIAKWPIIGSLCVMAESVFIDRRPEKINETKSALKTTLACGDILCLFPEGTTSDGRHLEPFKSSYFSLAEELIDGHELSIQPAAIAYTHIRGLPIDTTQWPSIAWYGDMVLFPHLMNLLKIAPIEAELIFLPPVTLAQHGDRKQLAAHCQRVISDAIHEVKNRPHQSKTKRLAFQPRFLRVKN